MYIVACHSLSLISLIWGFYILIMCILSVKDNKYFICAVNEESRSVGNW